MAFSQLALERIAELVKNHDGVRVPHQSGVKFLDVTHAQHPLALHKREQPFQDVGNGLE